MFLSNAERCSVDQHKYLWKRRTHSSLKGSFTSQRTTTGCYNTKSFSVEVQPFLTSKRCATGTEQHSQFGRHIYSFPPRHGVVAIETSHQASVRTRMTHHGNTESSMGPPPSPLKGHGRYTENCLQQPLFSFVWIISNLISIPPVLSKGSVLLGTKLINSAHIGQGRGKPKYCLQIQNYHNSPRPVLCAN